MKNFTRYVIVSATLSVRSNVKTAKIFFLALLLCCCGFKGFATAWTTSATGPVTTLTNWTDGTTSPTSFTTPGDTWAVTLPMTMSSSVAWIVGTASSTPVTVTVASGGSITGMAGSFQFLMTVYGNLNIADTITSQGGAAVLRLNVDGDVSITGGSIFAEGGGIKLAVNIYGNLTMTGGTIYAEGAETTGSTPDTVNVAGNFSMSGTSLIAANGAGAACGVFLSYPSSSGTMMIDNTSTGTWEATNVYVNPNCTAQLDGNFSTTTGSATYGVTVNGTLICPAAYVVNGTNKFTLTSGATLEVANAAGINGAITTTGTTTFNTAANYVFNGTAAQVTGTYLPVSLISPSTLTISNSAGVKLSQTTATTGVLAFTNGILNTTSAYTMSTPGVASAVTGAGATSYVDGTLIKTITGLTTVNYEVGDNDYAPMSLALSAAGTTGSIGLMSTYGLHPSVASSGLSTSNMANHYWTITNDGAAGPATVTPTATYNAADIIGGSNSAFETQEYAGSAWLGSALATTNTSSPYTSTPTTGIALGTLAGAYIFGDVSCGTLPISGTPTLCETATTNLSDATSGGTWSSSDAGVATVSGGVVTGVAGGTAIISYTAGGCTSTTVVTVNAAPDAGIIAGVTSACISLATSLSDGITGGVWSSSNTSVATVSGGLVTGVTAGSAIISYTVTNSCGTATATVNVMVGTTLTVSQITGADSVCPGYIVTLSDSTGGGVWSSNNTSIATIDGSGDVTGVTTGTDTILYIVTNSCGTDTVSFIINVNPASSDCNTSIINTAANSTALNIFPNPNNGTFTVNLLSDIDEAVQVVITNIVGETVNEYTGVTNTAIAIQIDAVPGIYLVKASGEHGKYVTKIAVQ